MFMKTSSMIFYTGVFTIKGFELLILKNLIWPQFRNQK